MAALQQFFTAYLPDGTIYMPHGTPAVLSTSKLGAQQKLAEIMILDQATTHLRLRVDMAIIQSSPGATEATAGACGGEEVLIPQESHLSRQDRQKLLSAGRLREEIDQLGQHQKIYALIESMSFRQLHEIHGMSALQGANLSEDAFLVFFSEGRAPEDRAIATVGGVNPRLQEIVATATVYLSLRDSDQFFPVIGLEKTNTHGRVILLAGHPVASVSP